jgi:2-polyprenyl-3-methyl-5-hydroxy-6-metoxy-1,4-benzoquinol methylase
MSHARQALGDMLGRFWAGEDALLAIEAAELGDISGKRVLHLQCHIGRDTLCLAQRGAVVTGLYFLPAAIECARRLSMESGLTATFIQGTVDQTPRLAPGPFDLVFTTSGILCWLPDMRDWARVIASVLAPGGELYCAMRIRASWRWRSRPAGSCRHSISKLLPTGRWNSSIPSRRSAIFGSLIDAGLAITMFHEHEVLPWRRYAAQVTVRSGETIALSGDARSLVPATDRLWRLRDGHPRMPLSFSIRARKLI